MRNLFLYPVEALNAIRSNVWSVLLIAAGLCLVHWGHNTEGSSLITGAFALLKSDALFEKNGDKVTTPQDPSSKQDPTPKP